MKKFDTTLYFITDRSGFDDEEFLRNLGAMGKDRKTGKIWLTAAGLLLLGTGVGGMYLIIQLVGEGIYKGNAPKVPFPFTTSYALMIVLAPLAFVWLIIVRLRQLSKLRKIEMEDIENEK